MRSNEEMELWKRAHRAAGYIKAGMTHGRELDNAFENHDGDEMCAALGRMAQRSEKLAATIYGTVCKESVVENMAKFAHLTDKELSDHAMATRAKCRLEWMHWQIKNGYFSHNELTELKELRAFINPSDTLLLQLAEKESIMETVKIKACKCGNKLTLSAKVTGRNSTAYRIDGSINVDADNRALCACNKIHHFRAPLEKWINEHQPNRRLEYLRQEIEAERISYGEIAELQELASFIEPEDTLLRQWAGLPEGE